MFEWVLNTLLLHIVKEKVSFTEDMKVRNCVYNSLEILDLFLRIQG